MLPQILSVAAPVVWFIGFLLMWRHVEPFYTHFYPLAWWCYILWLAACNELRDRPSPFSFPSLFRRPIQYGVLVLLSAAVWFFFELYNARLHNWGYVGVPVQRWIRWPGYFVAFGTVLPGIFETARWLEGWGPLQRLEAAAGRGGHDESAEDRHVHWNKISAAVAVLFGLLCMILPLLYPAWVFPVIWIGLVFILDPIIDSLGEPNLVVNLFLGDRRRPLLLLTSGALCGLFWEFWNYWSGAKWIYTLPYFHSWKIFEMPLVGYLGFLPFALECWLLYLFVRLCWGRSRLLGRVAVVVVLAAICIAGVCVVDHFVVKSYQVVSLL